MLKGRSKVAYRRFWQRLLMLKMWMTLETRLRNFSKVKRLKRRLKLSKVLVKLLNLKVNLPLPHWVQFKVRQFHQKNLFDKL